jgi:hypothetical protein
MSWIILEGLDRTGKTTVAEYYKRQGYQIVHMSAPDKKYSKPGYTGPSYLDELLDVYMRYTGKDVIFDRSGYGEFVWPFVYGRSAQLSDEDVEILQDIEEKNDTQKILMYDANIEAHWKRCVDNNEPLTRPQFNSASVLFDKMARKYNFEKKQLSDFSTLSKAALPSVPEASNSGEEDNVKNNDVGTVLSQNRSTVAQSKASREIYKLEQANAINDILNKRIIKQKGEIYDKLESDIRHFLEHKLSTIFGEDKNKNFSDDEIEILKLYCKQIKQKLGAK